MKTSNANKVISVLMSVAMCPMMVPSAAFAADDDMASGGGSSSSTELTQSSGQAEGADTGASSGTTSATQPEAAGTTTTSNENAASAATAGEAGAAAAAGEENSGSATGEETATGVAEVNGTSYPSLQAAIDAASRKATVKLLADTKENVTISTPYVTLDLNGYTLNGSTGERKPALTVTNRVYVMDSSEAQMGTIMREDTAENSGVSSHYVIDVQGGNSGWLFFQSGNVKNDSGAGGTNGASLVRVGDDSKPGVPGLTISGGTFTQDNFIVLKCDYGNLYVKGGTINSANSYAVQNWKNATIKDSAVINGNISTWTYGGGGSDLQIQGGTVNGDIESVTYDGAEGKAAKVAITGGTVNGSLYTIDYSTGATTDDPTKATIEVTAGTFSTDPSRYLIEGSTATPNVDGTYGVEKAYLAQVGETSYYTMDEAFKAQTASGEAITLLRDYTTGSTFNSGTVARVVDLNGHTWTCTGTDANSAAFEINYPDASLTVKNGKVVSSQLIGLIPSASAGTITYDNSTLTFEGVEASTTATSGIETNGNNTNDTVVLKNSTLNVPNGFGIYFPSSGTLTIDNSTINAKTMGVQVCSGSLNVNAGSTIAVTGDPVVKTEPDGAIQDGAAISVVNRPGYKGLGKIAITGGTFTAKAGNAAIKAYTWDSSTKQESAFDNSAKTVTVSGGTFSSAVSSDLCAEGFAPVKNEDGTYGIATAVAQIGETAYASVQDAIDAAQADDAVKLLKDATENITVDASKQITLDLNGYTLNGGTGSAKATILNKGNVTITDTSAGKTGTIKRDDQGVEGETSYYVIRNIGTMVIDQANVVNNSGYKKTNPSGSMVGSSLICNGDDDPQASLTINGGAFTQPNFLVVKNGTNGMLAVNGGTLTSNHSAVQNWNKAQILGGSLKGQIWTDAYVEGMIGETVIGGDAQFEGEIVVDITGSVPPTVKIEGGKLDIASWKVTAAAAKADATIAVSGGTFMAAVPEAYCAAGYTPADNGDGTFGVKLPDGAYALQDYRSGDPASWTYPTQEDKAFAGWYKDPAFKTPYTASDVEGAAYAKFVDITALLQFKGGSLRMDKGEAAVSTDLRFGYTKAIPEGATYISNGWYIKSLKEGSAKDDSVEASNNVLNNDGTVTSNLVLIDVPKNCYKLDFAEKAFVKYVTVDGTAVEAIESQYQSRSVSAVADAILRHPMASQHEKQYANEIKSAIQ